MNTSGDLISSGLESTAYRVKDGHRDVILKRPKLGGRQNYLFEAYAYRQLHALGALVPEVIRVSSDEIAMTQLKGQELDEHTNLYTNESLFAAIAQNLAHCSEVKFQGFGSAIQKDDFFMGEDSTWGDFLGKAESLFEGPDFSGGGLDKNDMGKLRATWSAQKPHMNLTEGTLVHGDLAMSSLFVEGKTFTGIIDFGDALIGDPLMDIAYFRLKEISKSYGEDIYQRLLRHYAKACRLTVNGELERKIIFYMIYWGLRRLEHCPDPGLKEKFANKLKIVVSKI